MKSFSWVVVGAMLFAGGAFAKSKKEICEEECDTGSKECTDACSGRTGKSGAGKSAGGGSAAGQCKKACDDEGKECKKECK